MTHDDTYDDDNFDFRQVLNQIRDLKRRCEALRNVAARIVDGALTGEAAVAALEAALNAK